MDSPPVPECRKFDTKKEIGKLSKDPRIKN